VVGAEVGRVHGEEEGAGQVGVVFGEPGLHLEHVLGEVVLAGKRVHAREVVDLLVGVHLAEGVHADRRVRPAQVPLSLLLEGQRVVQLPADLLHHFVLRVAQVDGDWPESALGRRALCADIGQFYAAVIVVLLLEPHLFYYSVNKDNKVVLQ
jgi:hypothetical protein